MITLYLGMFTLCRGLWLEIIFEIVTMCWFLCSVVFTDCLVFSYPLTICTTPDWSCFSYLPVLLHSWRLEKDNSTLSNVDVKKIYSASENCEVEVLSVWNYKIPMLRSIYLSVGLSVCLPVCLSACLPACLPACPPTSIYLSIYIYGSTALVELGRFFSLLMYTQSVGLLGRGISPSQGRYLYRRQHKHRINSHRHLCLKWDWNPRSQCSSGRRWFMP
jgi:hypothetical protein